MQSILTISPTKGSPSEASRGNLAPKLDGDIDNQDSKDKTFKGFAEVLGTFTDKKQQLSDIKQLKVDPELDTTDDIAEKSIEAKVTGSSLAKVELLEGDESAPVEDDSQLPEAVNLPKEASVAQQNHLPSIKNEEMSRQQEPQEQPPLDKQVIKKEEQDNFSTQLSQNIEVKPLDKEPNSDGGWEIEGIAAKLTPNKEIGPSVNKTDISFKEPDSQVSNTQVSNTQVTSADMEGNLDVLKMTSNNEVAPSTKEMQSEVLNKKATTSDIKENLDPLKTAFDDKVVPSVKGLGSEAANEKVTTSDAKELGAEALKVVTSNETIIPDKKIDAVLSKATPNNDVLSDQEGDVDTPKIMSNHDSSFIDKEFDVVELKKESSNETTLSEGKSNAEALNVSPTQGVASSTKESTVSLDKKEFSEEVDVSAKEPLLDSVEESPPLPETLNPILAQIETAQKVDTKVNDLKNKPSFTKEVSGLKGSKDSSLLVGKEEKVSAENILTEEGIKDDKSIKELSPQPNKIDSIISSLKQDSDKPIFGVNHETHIMRATAASVSDRILNQTASNTPLMQSAALQQPIELQSKQASVMMGERIMMMLGQGKQEVTIRLDPAELGSMHIKLHVQQEQLQVAIQTQVGQSRDIIEQNLPRLREQLAQQGITLGEASVEQQSRQQGQSESQHSQSSSNALQAKSGRSEHLVDEQSEWLATQIPLPTQGIDYYA